MHLPLFLTLCVCVPAPLPQAPGVQDPGTSYRFEVVGHPSPSQRARLFSQFDAATAPDGRIRVVVLPEELAAFRRLGLRTRLLDRGRPFAEVRAEWLRKLPEAPPDPLYYTVNETIAFMDGLVRTYPKLARRVDLTTLRGAARTHNGQGIHALKISDHVSADEDEPAILIAAQHHARELNAPVMVLQAMKRILEGYGKDPALTAVVDAYELYLVPTVNPDGVDWVWTRDRWWRKNRRGGYGVDLNRNYPFLWGRCGSSTLRSSQVYRGPSAASEPETRTMMAFAQRYRPEIYVDFHSYGQEVLFTYAPCATVSSGIRSYLGGWVTNLRSAMGYRSRNPSASGEAPEYHWSSSGTLSFLVEVGRSFQPSFASTLAEEKRVWPGVRRALTTWRPPLRGHVRSIFKNQGVEAEITYSPSSFFHGEKVRSRAADGRYALWAPPGTYRLTFRAPGFETASRTVTLAAGKTLTLDVGLVPAMPKATLTKSGSDRLGTTTRFTYTSPGDAGATYWIALSTGTSPGLPIGSRTIPLNPDGLMDLSAQPGALLRGNLGILPGTATATADFPIPALPFLAGFTVHAGGLTLDKDWAFSVKKFSAPIRITLRR